jgi:hypothetical protein
MEQARSGPTLRDIRPDINVRLKEAVALRDFHRESAEKADLEVDALTKMLDRENARFGQQDQTQRRGVPQKTLPEFVLEQLVQSTLTKAQLAEAANVAGYFKPADYPLRVIHAVTVNLLRANKIREVADGMYDLAEEVAS